MKATKKTRGTKSPASFFHRRNKMIEVCFVEPDGGFSRYKCPDNFDLADVFEAARDRGAKFIPELFE